MKCIISGNPIGDLEHLEKWLSFFSDNEIVKMKDNFGQNLLHLFVQEKFRHEKCEYFIRLFLNKGVNVNCKNYFNQPLLIYVINKLDFWAEDFHFSIIRLLLEHKADVNETYQGKNSLQILAEKFVPRKTEIAKLLIEAGVQFKDDIQLSISPLRNMVFSSLILVPRNKNLHQDEKKEKQIIQEHHDFFQLLLNKGMDINWFEKEEDFYQDSSSFLFDPVLLKMITIRRQKESFMLGIQSSYNE
jgi:ankyrin repeat protein